MNMVKIIFFEKGKQIVKGYITNVVPAEGSTVRFQLTEDAKIKIYKVKQVHVDYLLSIDSIVAEHRQNEVLMATNLSLVEVYVEEVVSETPDPIM